MHGDSIDIVDRLARVETKLDILLAVHSKREERIAALERWRSHITGWVAGISVLAGLVGSFLGSFLLK